MGGHAVKRFRMRCERMVVPPVVAAAAAADQIGRGMPSINCEEEEEKHTEGLCVFVRSFQGKKTVG